MEKISIIIPVYNSESSLTVLNDEIDACFSDHDYLVEKIFVDDASRDNSFMLLESLAVSANNLHTIKIIRLKINAGQQNALFCGLHYATGDYIVTMDDDLQHDISYVKKMINLLQSGIDLVYGVHQNSEIEIRSIGSKLTGYFFRKTFPILDGKRVSSFRAFNKSSLQSVLQCQYKFIYLSALLLKSVKTIENIEIVKRERRYGQSGYSLNKLIVLFLKLNYYYGNFVPEFLKPVGVAYEESDDVGCWKLSAECH